MSDKDWQVLAAAFLWLRNQYDVGRPELKAEVLETVDRVLADYGPTAVDLARFRRLYGPRKKS